MVLPSYARQSQVRAFWFVMAFWVGLAVAALAPLSVEGRALADIAAAFLVATTPLIRPREARVVYRLWTRGARLYARGARYALLALCYGIVLTAVGVTGSRLWLRRPAPGESLWEVRRTLPASAYRSQYDDPAPELRHRWRAVVDWACQSRNAWVLALAPFLVLVEAFDTEDEAPQPVGIYTLF
jgi:hypothetical protein